MSEISYFDSDVFFLQETEGKIQIKNKRQISKKVFNAFIINKGIQKACESYRLGKDIKEQLKGLKLK